MSIKRELAGLKYFTNHFSSSEEVGNVQIQITHILDIDGDFSDGASVSFKLVEGPLQSSSLIKSN